MTNTKIKHNSAIWYILASSACFLKNLLARLFQIILIKLGLRKRKKHAQQTCFTKPIQAPEQVSNPSKKLARQKLIQALKACESEYEPASNAINQLLSDAKYMSCVLKKAKNLVPESEVPNFLDPNNPQDVAAAISKIKQKVESGELTSEEGEVLITFFQRCAKILQQLKA